MIDVVKNGGDNPFKILGLANNKLGGRKYSNRMKLEHVIEQGFFHEIQNEQFLCV